MATSSSPGKSLKCEPSSNVDTQKPSLDYCSTIASSQEHTEKKKRRLKRGGNRTVLSLEETGDPSQALYENSATPEQVFDRQWATALLDRALTTLETEYSAKGKGELFKALRPYLSSDQATEPQEVVALRLGKKVGALRMDLNRLRNRFAEVYRRTVAETIPSWNSRVVDEEIAYLGSLFT